MGDACHHHHSDGPPSAGEVERALLAAETRLIGEGERMAAAGSRVLALLRQSGEPVKA